MAHSLSSLTNWLVPHGGKPRLLSTEYVQYGCGLSAPESWTNFDASPTLRIQKVPVLGGLALFTRGGPRFPKNVRYGDIVKGLPVAVQSCRGIYCSHVLEHLSLEDLRTAIRNTLAYLKPGGIFRGVLPDLEIIVERYQSSRSQQPAVAFMEATNLGTHTRSRGLRGLLRDRLGNSKHLWMWDYRSLSCELERAGFISVRRASFGDSGDLAFGAVEDAARWEGCLGIEGRKA